MSFYARNATEISGMDFVFDPIIVNKKSVMVMYSSQDYYPSVFHHQYSHQ